MLCLVAVGAVFACSSGSSNTPSNTLDAGALDSGVADAGGDAGDAVCTPNGDTELNEPSFPEIRAPGTGQLYARFVTSMGSMVAKLEEQLAPKSVKNFVGLATGWQDFSNDKGEIIECTPFYPGTIFHRVIPGFMIQGGGAGPGYSFQGERGLKHDAAGVLALANAGPNTDGSQFYITDGAAAHLDSGEYGTYSVFGKVLVGLDVISKISGVERDAKDKPKADVVLQKVEIFRSESVPMK